MIGIYANTLEWGGVDVLVDRFCDDLLSRGIDFCVIKSRANEHGRERFKERLLWIEDVDRSAKSITHVLFTTITLIRDTSFPWSSLSHARMLAWIVHPNDPYNRFFPYSTLPTALLGYYGVRPIQRILAGHQRILESLFDHLLSTQGLVAMDGATRRAFGFYYPSTAPTSPPLVPIPSPVSAESHLAVGGTSSSRKLSIGYLGRIDSMKWSALAPLVRYQLSALAKRVDLSVHLIAEGSHLLQLTELCRIHRIQCTAYGYMTNAKSRELLARKANVVVAMGTSALDLAGAGIACLVIDPALGALAPRQERFRFVHEIDEFTLGEYRDFPGYPLGPHTFEEAMERASDRTGKLGREYVRASHDPSACFTQLLERLFASQAFVGSVAPIVREIDSSFMRLKRWTKPGFGRDAN